MQLLGLEYLRFADGRAKAEVLERQEEFRRELIDTLVKGSLVASGEYEAKIVFRDYFPEEEESAGGSANGDAETDLDYSGVDFSTPDRSEMEMLAHMLADDMVTVDGSPLEGPGAEQVPPPDDSPSLPPPREFGLDEVEQDSEWV